MPAADAVRALPARILIVRLGALGDVINGLALANALIEARADLHLGWVGHDLVQPILRGHPALRRVHLWPRGGGWRSLLELRRELRAERYDAVLDLQRLAKSALLARAVGTPRTIGFDRGRAKECSWLLHAERVAPADAARPMAEQALDFARHLGLRPGPARIDLPLWPEAEAWAEQRLAGVGSPVALNIGATKPANRWPAERWGELARRLKVEGGVEPVLTGGPSDRPLADAVMERAGVPLVDLVGATDLRQLAAILRRVKTVVSADTGPMHLAAAVGSPIVALFGAADERRTGPLGQLEHVVRTNPPCAPCGKRDCPRPRHDCMLDLGVERVLSAVRSRLGSSA